MKKITRKQFYISMITIILAIFLYYRISSAIDWVHALLVTLDIVDNKKLNFIDRFIEIKVAYKEYTFPGETIPVKIFTSGNKKKMPAILVAHGLAPDGYNDSRLTQFARSLAKTGAVVFLPNFSYMQNVRIKPVTAKKMQFLFDRMCELPYVDKNRAGFFPISYAGGPGTMAFSEPPYNEKTRYIIYLGGYYQLSQVLVFGLSGKSRFNGHVYSTEPSRWGRWYYLLSNLEYVENAEDRKHLFSIAETKRRYPWYDISETEKKLTAAGKKLLEMIKHTDPEKIMKLIRKQNENFRDTLKIMSPAHYIHGLAKTKVFLLHASNDPLVPYTESLYFYQAMKKAGGKPSLTIINALEHVDMIKKPFTLKNILSFYLPELIKMTNVVYEIIRT